VATSSSVAQPFDNEAVRGMIAGHVERFVTDGRKVVRRLRSDDGDVAATGNDVFPVDSHCCLAGTDDGGFGIGMLTACLRNRALSCCNLNVILGRKRGEYLH
jgi:hypothetical protein